MQGFLPVNDKEKAKLDYLNILLILIWEFSSASSKGVYFKPQLLKTQELTRSSLSYFKTSANPMSHTKTYWTVQLVDPEGASKTHTAFGEMMEVNNYLVAVAENLAFRWLMRPLEFLYQFRFHLFCFQGMITHTHTKICPTVILIITTGSIFSLIRYVNTAKYQWLFSILGIPRFILFKKKTKTNKPENFLDFHCKSFSNKAVALMLCHTIP